MRRLFVKMSRKNNLEQRAVATDSSGAQSNSFGT